MTSSGPVLVAGASGFVGRRLCDVARARGHDVIPLSRSGAGGPRWDPLSEPAPLEGAEAVVHLAAEPLTEGRWTRAKMTRIRLQYLPDPGPCGTAVRVSGLMYDGFLIEAEAIAVITR